MRIDYPAPMRRPTHEHILYELDPVCIDWPEWAVEIVERLHRLEGMIMTSQEHLDSDVASLKAAISTEVANLKTQIGNLGVGDQVDFTGLDNLVASTQADAAATAPQIGSPVTTATEAGLANSGASPVTDPTTPDPSPTPVDVTDAGTTTQNGPGTVAG